MNARPRFNAGYQDGTEASRRVVTRARVARAGYGNVISHRYAMGMPSCPPHPGDELPGYVRGAAGAIGKIDRTESVCFNHNPRIASTITPLAYPPLFPSVWI